jgi:hypothetical protein
MTGGRSGGHCFAAGRGIFHRVFLDLPTAVHGRALSLDLQQQQAREKEKVKVEVEENEAFVATLTWYCSPVNRLENERASPCSTGWRHPVPRA